MMCTENTAVNKQKICVGIQYELVVKQIIIVLGIFENLSSRKLKYVRVQWLDVFICIIINSLFKCIYRWTILSNTQISNDGQTKSF